MQTDSPKQTGSHSKNQQVRDAGSPGGSPSRKRSPIPEPPPPLASITNRRRLEEYSRGEIFERTLGSATLDFAMIPHL
jgi:hypothetical protein